MTDKLTMRDRDRAKAIENKLEICEACGWYSDRFGHDARCSPHAGRVADALAAEFPDGNPTKLGYGPKCLAFELDEDTHVRFHVNGRGEISLEEIHALARYEISDAGALVRALAKALTR